MDGARNGVAFGERGQTKIRRESPAYQPELEGPLDADGGDFAQFNVHEVAAMPVVAGKLRDGRASYRTHHYVEFFMRLQLQYVP